MSDEKAPEQPKKINIGTPRFKPTDVVRYDYQSLHLVSRVIYAKFVENQTLGDKCEWQYMIEGNPQGLIPERFLSKA